MTKNLHILIDGPDRVGKSTVCQILSRRYDLPVIKMPNMPEYVKKGNTEEMSWLFNQTIAQFHEYGFIMDRGYTSSLAYSRAFNRDFDLSYIEQIKGILRPYVFILYRDDGKEPNDDLYPKSELDLVKQEFLNLADFERVHPINVEDMSPCEIVTEIDRILTKS